MCVQTEVGLPVNRERNGILRKGHVVCSEVVNSFQHPAGKGKAKLSKSQLSNRFSFAIKALKKVNLYIEA